MFKILAPELCGIVKLLRHIIYDRNKEDVKISAPDENYCAYQKYRCQSYATIRKSAPKLCVCKLFGLGRISNC
jgi:hypothetical protein